MKSRTLRIVLALSLIFNVSVLATAAYLHAEKNGYWVSPCGVKIKKDRFLFEELSLRPDQLRKMREKAVPFRAQIDAKRQEIAAKRDQLFALMRAETADRQAIEATLSGISAIQAELETMVVNHILQEKAALNKEQQQKFLDMIEHSMTQERMACLPAGGK